MDKERQTTKANDNAVSVSNVPAECEALRDAEAYMMSNDFAAISEDRRRELDTLCDPMTPESEVADDQAQWDEYFEEQSKNMTPVEAKKLWERIYVSDYEFIDPPKFGALQKPVCPCNDLEKKYVEWRTLFNMQAQTERVAVQAAERRKESRTLRGEVAENKSMIAETADGVMSFVAKLREKMTQQDVDLFFLLIAPKEKGSNKVLSLEDIGKRLGTKAITKQAVSARVKKFSENNQEAWKIVEPIRERKASPIQFSALSPSERRKRGVDESYGYNAVE